MGENKSSLEGEKSRLQNQVNELDKTRLQLETKLHTLEDELQKQRASSAQQLAEEKELQARLLNEVEERERAHQESHQLKKQVLLPVGYFQHVKYL